MKKNYDFLHKRKFKCELLSEQFLKFLGFSAVDDQETEFVVLNKQQVKNVEPLHGIVSVSVC